MEQEFENIDQLMNRERIAIDPKLRAEQKKELLDFCRGVRRSLKPLVDADQKDKVLLKWKAKVNGMYAYHKYNAYTDLAFVKNLVLDLLLQGWELVFTGGKVFLELVEDAAAENISDLKSKTRRRHLLARDVQLAVNSVAKFVSEMEKRRLTSKGWHSIFSLMRDGADLQQQLQSVTRLPEEQHAGELASIIQPYIQFVEAGKRCAHTGLLLSEIWRYFRHTWITEYKSLPGRSISILIRDAAAPNHPVIGIAALGSSVAQQACRDEWIGWEGKTFLAKLDQAPSGKYGKWLLDTLEQLLKETYVKDFIKEKVITRAEMNRPTKELMVRLKQLAVKYKDKHTANPNAAKFVEKDNPDWKRRAETFLFKSKRAALLGELLSVRDIFNRHGLTTGTTAQLKTALAQSEFRYAVQRLVRKAKGIHVGINMMDIIICGSIAPYNHLLGGKLVCMLLASPEIVKYYNSKYEDAQSIIASSMQAKAVVRKPQLVLLGTTSLYGVGSSQYNRIKIPASEVGGLPGRFVQYKELGTSEGFGSFHFSTGTIKLADTVAGRENGRMRVNSIFGEGANPLLRKLRESIDYLGLDSEPILNHRNRRVVYGIALAENFGDVLLGLSSKPRYIIPQERAKEKTAAIAAYWKARWLLNRIRNEEVMQRVTAHTLTYPITHGARVPTIKNEEQLDLFEITKT